MVVTTSHKYNSDRLIDKLHLLWQMNDVFFFPLMFNVEGFYTFGFKSSILRYPLTVYIHNIFG